MHPDWTDCPFSVFSDVAQHIFGRIFLLLSTIAVAAFLGSGIAASTGHHIGWLGGITLYPIMITGGIAQIWGIFIYGLLLFFYCFHHARCVPQIAFAATLKITSYALTHSQQREARKLESSILVESTRS